MGKATVLVNTPNTTSNFYPANDKWEMKKLPMKASTAMVEGAAIAIEISSNTTTGNYTLMGVENVTGADFVGILAEPIVKGVRVPVNQQAEAFFTVGAGTFTAVDVGKTVEIHSDSKSLAVDTAGKGARITKYITSTRGKCAFVLPNTETA